MADVVIVGCLFTFLLINVCHGGPPPGLVDPDEDTRSSGSDMQQLEDPKSSQKMTVHHFKYKCHQCESPGCDTPGVCPDALFCFKSSVRDSDGTLRHSRGCSAGHDHAQFTCRLRPQQRARKRHLGHVNVTCCKGDLCNTGEFPELAAAEAAVEPLPAQPWKLWAGALAALGVAIVPAALLLRRAHKYVTIQRDLCNTGEFPELAAAEAAVEPLPAQPWKLWAGALAALGVAIVPAALLLRRAHKYVTIQRDLCNTGEFPELAAAEAAVEPLPAQPWKLWAGALAALGVAIVPAALLLRRAHKYVTIQRDLCNTGEFPELAAAEAAVEPLPAQPWKLWAGALAALGVAIVPAALLLRRAHKYVTIQRDLCNTGEFPELAAAEAAVEPLPAQPWKLWAGALAALGVAIVPAALLLRRAHKYVTIQRDLCNTGEFPELAAAEAAVEPLPAQPWKLWAGALAALGVAIVPAALLLRRAHKYVTIQRDLCNTGEFPELAAAEAAVEPLPAQPWKLWAGALAALGVAIVPAALLLRRAHKYVTIQRDLCNTGEFPELAAAEAAVEPLPAQPWKLWAGALAALGVAIVPAALLLRRAHKYVTIQRDLCNTGEFPELAAAEAAVEPLPAQPWKLWAGALAALGVAIVPAALLLRRAHKYVTIQRDLCNTGEFPELAAAEAAVEPLPAQPWKLWAGALAALGVAIVPAALLLRRAHKYVTIQRDLCNTGEFPELAAAEAAVEPLPAQPWKLWAGALAALGVAIVPAALLLRRAHKYVTIQRDLCNTGEFPELAAAEAAVEPLPAQPWKLWAGALAALGVAIVPAALLLRRAHKYVTIQRDLCNTGEFPELAAAEAAVEPLPAQPWKLWAGALAALGVAIVPAALLLRRAHKYVTIQRDLCNTGEFPELAAAEAAVEPLPAQPWKLWAGALAALGVAIVPAALLLRRAHKLRVSRAALHKLGPDSNYFSSNMYSPQVTSAYYDGVENSQNGVRATLAGDSTLREYLQGSVSSGSGSGLPLMVQRTLSKQVSLLECVGMGRYGKVWRGLWYADSVAVKIFFSRDEASWQRETEIYSTVLLRHANILAYIGSDMTSRNSCTQLWLITHYHPLGSLYEHLARTTLTRHQMMLICLSTVNGLLHLHTDIHGTQGKPAIAHRDIKSKNILVKVNGECCIADFGLAVTARHVERQEPSARQGTVRYMSPEVLDQSMNLQCFESYRKTDIYALALVLWEVCRRVSPAREARAPFHELAPSDPEVELMRKIVCVDGARPDLPDTTKAHPTMAGMGRLMRECWHQNASVRLPALRIKKTLLKLAANDNSIHLDEDSEVFV